MRNRSHAPMRARSTNVLSALACRVPFHSDKPVKWRRFLPPETFPPGTVRCSNRRMKLGIRHGQDGGNAGIIEARLAPPSYSTKDDSCFCGPQRTAVQDGQVRESEIEYVE